MYTLRIIEEIRENENVPFGQVIENHLLGKSYATLKRNLTPEFGEELKRLQIELGNNFPNIDLGGIETIVCGSNNDQFFIVKDTPLVRHDYFIMSSNGETFERL